MLTVYQYVIFWSILFVSFGAVWYNFDRRFGIKWYRSWYNMTRKEKLTTEKQIGFIYNRSTHSKAAMAALVASAQSVMVVMYMDVNLLASLIMWVVEIPLMMLGFYLGPFVYAMWRKKETLFTTMDKVESGELNIGTEVTKAAKRVVAPIKEHLEDLQEAIIGGAEENEPIPVQPSEDELRLKQLESVDPRELMAKFTNPRGDE